MSNINYLGINENFPVAGQDNDTQVFRDNFDTIKTNFRLAQEEITALENATDGINTTAIAGDAGADFNGRIIQDAVFQNCKDTKVPLGNVSVTTPLDYENGNYFIATVGANVNFTLDNFPGDPAFGDTSTSVGKVMLELYSDGSSRNVSFITTGGTVIKKDSNFPTTITVSSNTDPIFIEIWRHSQEVIYMRYLGQFS